MPHPLDTTFDLLALSPNEAAVDLLIGALEVPDDQVKVRAVSALLRSRPTRGLIEIIRRAKSLPAAARELIERSGRGLARGLRESLLSTDPALRENALALTELLEEFALVPVLVQLLEESTLPARAEIEHAIYELAAGLYEHLHFRIDRDEASSHLRDAQRIRHELLAALETASNHYPAHRCRQVVEGLLLLGDPDNMHLKRLFREAPEEVRALAGELLCTSNHPGVMALVFDSLAQNYPFAAALAAFSRRTDPEFICHVLRHWPRKLSPFQQKNFKELRSVAWLDAQELHLESVPPALHRALIAFLMSTGLTQQQKLSVLEWMVLFGSPEGRVAATEVLVDLEDEQVQEVVLGSLESDEPDVQAWATKQLRNWSIPRAMQLLIERLDSPIPEVQQAARDELAGFNIHRALEMYEHLDRKTQVAIGKLVQKIDPETVQKLCDEVRHTIRSKRIRAARGALALNLHLEVADAVILMARDSDNLVRRTAAEVLASIPTRESAAALMELARDASPRVRQAAETALSRLRESERERPEPPAPEPIGAEPARTLPAQEARS